MAIKERPPVALQNTRNSQFRKTTDGPVHTIVSKWHEGDPSETADRITLKALLGIAVGSIASYFQNKEKDKASHMKGRLVPLGILTVAVAADRFDGAMFRLFEELGIEPKDGVEKVMSFLASRLEEKKEGMTKEEKEKERKRARHLVGNLFDSAADRVGGQFMVQSRIAGAHARGGILGALEETMGNISGAAAVVPSLIRARAEEENVYVLESGKNLFQFFGTHPGRMLLAVPATAFQEIDVTIKGKRITIPVALIADTIIAAASIDLARERAHDIKKTRQIRKEKEEYGFIEAKSKEQEEKDDVARREASVRVKTTAALGALTLLALGATYKALRKNN